MSDLIRNLEAAGFKVDVANSVEDLDRIFKEKMMNLPQTGVLSPDCETMLEQYGFCSEECTPAYAVIRGVDDGEMAFRVTRGINVFDLGSLFYYGEKLYRRGREHGERSVKQKMRELMNLEG